MTTRILKLKTSGDLDLYKKVLAGSDHYLTYGGEFICFKVSESVKAEWFETKYTEATIVEDEKETDDIVAHYSNSKGIESIDGIKFKRFQVMTTVPYKDYVKEKDDKYLVKETANKKSLFKKLEENWKELKDFKAGKTKDVVHIVHKFIPVYILLNQHNELKTVLDEQYKECADILKAKADEFAKLGVEEAWKDGAKNYCIDRLCRIGLFIKDKSAVAKELTSDLIAEIIGKRPLLLEDAIFLYDETKHHYKFFDLAEAKFDLGAMYLKKSGEYLKEAQINELIHNVRVNAKAFGTEYDLGLNTDEEIKVPLVFNNGTLYMNGNGREFKANHWDREDNCFLAFELDYDEKLINGDTTMFDRWVSHRFEGDKKTILSCLLGDLVATSMNSHVHGYIFGKGGIGKSKFLDLFSSILTKNSVGHCQFPDLTSQFGAVSALKYPIIITDEAPNRAVKPTEYKSLISRDKGSFEYKGVQGFQGQRIAKILTFGNHQMSIDNDSGTIRRAISFEINGTKLGDNLSRMEFERAFNESKYSLLSFILDGIELNICRAWDIDKTATELIGEEREKMVADNSPVVEFLIEALEPTGDDEDKIDLKDFYERAYLEYMQQKGQTKLKTKSARAFYKDVEEYVNQNKVSIRTSRRRSYEISGYKHSEFADSLVIDNINKEGNQPF